MAERLIDANKLIYSISKKLIGLKAHEGLRAVRIVAECIVDAPTIEAKPVVHAHWENREFVNNSWIGIVCSNCEKHPLCDGFGKKVLSDYCPHCGAQMDEKGE